MITTQAKAVVVLASRLGDASRPSLSPTQWDRLHTTFRDLDIDIASVFDTGFDATAIEGVHPETAASIGQLLESAAAATIEASDLEQYGISVVTILDEEYPSSFKDRLGALSPPVLFIVGDRGLLTGDGIGIVGSRTVTKEGESASEAIARSAVSLGRSVVSGAARGVDAFAMNAAFLAGGTVVGVIADSLRARIREPEVLRGIDDDSICLLSQQHPNAGFTPASAMSRNKLVYALSETTVVVATDLDKGGTWAGAAEALREGNGRVAVWTGPGAGPGNASLIDLGASELASPEHLLDGPTDSPIAPAEQLDLLDYA